MRLPLFLAHGSLPLILGLLFFFVFLGYGLPAIVWWLTKRKRRRAALRLGVCTTAVHAVWFAAGFASAFKLAFEGALFQFVLFPAIPLALSLGTLNAAYRSPEPPTDR